MADRKGETVRDKRMDTTSAFLAAEKIPEGPSSKGATPRRRDRRLGWVLAAAALLITSTFVGLRQAPSGDPYHPPRRFGLAWWLHPVESHPEQRLPAVVGPVADLAVAPDGRDLWVVGSGGLILRSEDGGESWERVEIGSAGRANDGGGDQQGAPVARPASEKTQAETLGRERGFAAPGWSLLATPAYAAPPPVKIDVPQANQTRNRLDVPGGRLPSSALYREAGADQPTVSQRSLNRARELNAQSEQSVRAPSARRSLEPGWESGGVFRPVGARLSSPFWEVAFVDEQHGWISGGHGVLLRTEDGGRSWRARDSSTPGGSERLDFQDLSFVSAKEGCALLVQDGRAAYGVTQDGGATWTVLSAAVAAGSSRLGHHSCWFADRGKLVHVVPGGNGAMQPVVAPEHLSVLAVAGSDDGLWAVVDDGGLRRRRGSSWETVPLPSSEGLRGVDVTEDGAVWVWGLSTLWRSTDGGGSWQTMAPPDGFRIAGHPSFFGSDGVWVVGEGSELAEHRGGAEERWRIATRDSRMGRSSLAFRDDRIGLAGGADSGQHGFIARTEDGGRSWRRVVGDLPAPVIDVVLGDGSAWALERSGRLLASDDGGETWASLDPPKGVGEGARDLELDGRGRLVLLASESRIFVHSKDDSSWERVPVPPLGLRALSGVLIEENKVEGYGLTERGAVVPLAEGTSTSVAAPGTVALQQVGAQTWFGGPAGLSVAEGGSVRTVRPTPLAAFHFSDSLHGWVAEPGGGLLATRDAGGTWEDLDPYHRYPAPWYTLAVLLSIGLLAPALAPPPPERVDRSVAEMAVSDRPIGPGDPDPLGFEAIALGLSRFLRNAATQPPLTLAVSGEWGTGKSSLMNLLRADLRRYGFRPVWFNAWHHQQEEQLLAALLENVRRQAIPSWFRGEGIAFRARLLARRLRRWFVPSLLAVLAFGTITGYLVSRGEAGWKVIETLGHLLDPTSWPSLVASHAGPGAATDKPHSAALAFLLFALGGVFSLVRGLRAFGVKPGALMVGLSERARVRDAQAQTGFRYRFAREFEDVTAALAPRTLTIFIDDLDRCRPQNVLGLLEAVNFLVSSGDCYVVLGIDRERVERSVGFSFREVADELLSGEPGGETTNSEEDGRIRRADFARQYLEKLINVEVPVPRLGEDAGKALLRPVEEDREPRTPWQTAGRWIAGLGGRWVALPVALAFTLVLGLVVGSHGGSSPAPDAPVATGAVPGVATQEAALVGLTPTHSAGEDQGASDEEPLQVAAFRPAKPDGLSGTPFWLAVAILLVGAGLWVLTNLPEVEVHDSEEFATALESWYPLLYADRPTPRSIKRFLNRVRFYAMYQRRSEAPRSRVSVVLSRWLRWLSPRRARSAESGSPAAVPDRETSRPRRTGEAAVEIPEGILVGLATLQEAHPEWLEAEEFWEDPRAFCSRHGAAKTEGQDLGQGLAQFRQSFDRLSRGIETS